MQPLTYLTLVKEKTMTKIFLIITVLLNGTPVFNKELIGPKGATMEDCAIVAARYEAQKLSEGYTIETVCEKRQVGVDV